jgi:putative chitinase
MTLEQYYRIAAKATMINRGKYYLAIQDTLEKYDIDTPNRIAMFMAHLLHESAYMSAVRENLNYSAAGLMKVFPKYFSPTLAEKYARKPQMIANRVYALRMGNGNEESGDGWKYRGGAAFQLTGKDNYTAFGMDACIDTLNHPELIESPTYWAMSAGWFWDKNNLNAYADRDDIKGSTRVINGGYNGLAERAKLYNEAKKILIS